MTLTGNRSLFKGCVNGCFLCVFTFTAWHLLWTVNQSSFKGYVNRYSMLQSSYLLSAPHIGQLTVCLSYNKIANLSISIEHFLHTKSWMMLYPSVPREYILIYWCTIFLIPGCGNRAWSTGNWALRFALLFCFVCFCYTVNAVLSFSWVVIFSISFTILACSSSMPIVKVKGNINMIDSCLSPSHWCWY